MSFERLESRIIRENDVFSLFAFVSLTPKRNFIYTKTVVDRATVIKKMKKTLQNL